MPEGVEVYITAQWLNSLAKDQTIIGINWDKNSRYAKKPIIGLELAQLPLVVKAIFSRGKLIIWKCETKNHNKTNKKIIYMVCHLGMTGMWHKEKSKEDKSKGETPGNQIKYKQHSNFWVSFGKTDKIIDGQQYYSQTFKLYFNDYRKFGSISFYSDLSHLLKKNGPCMVTQVFLENIEMIDPEIQKPATLEIWLKYLANKRIANKPICEFLLDQKYVSGIGNYLRCCSLYLAKIHPETKLGEMSLEQQKELYKVCLEVIRYAYQTRGPMNGYFSDGQMILKCYCRKEDDDGNPIVKYKDKTGRTVHWCPNVQK